MLRHDDKSIHKATDGFPDTVVGLARLAEPPVPLSISRFPEHAPGREYLEAFVRTVFRQSYDACLSSFYPDLLSIYRSDGAVAAVAGVRAAARAPLFAEIYLDAPIEVLSAECAGRRISRHVISEVGNLAPAGIGQARWLIAALTAYLHGAGFSRVVFTAIPALYNAFTRMGLPLTVLAAADPSRLDPVSRLAWGRYYEAGPMVCIGDIDRGFQHISALIEPSMPRLRALWHEAKHAGAEQSPLPIAL